MTDRSLPYGSWPSPITAADVAESGIDLGHLELDGDDVYWREGRPGEDGRGVVVRADDGGRTDLTPDEYDVRTLVHEYGGGDFAVHDGVVWFVDRDDQRIYRRGTGGETESITPEPLVERGDRYADFEVTPDGDRLHCVRERHRPDLDEPANELVTMPADGSGSVETVAEGHDFYSFPRLDPAGDRLAWTTWDHPQMPWDGTTLHVADVDDDGGLANEREVGGGPEESVFQPAWDPDGRLHAVSDRTGWWNLYRVDPDGDDHRNLHPRGAELGTAQWVFGLSTYAFLDDGRIAVAVTEEGRRRLGILDPDDAAGKGGDSAEYDLRVPDLPVDVHKHARVRSDGERVVFKASSPTVPDRIVRWDPDRDENSVETLRDASTLGLDRSYVSRPEHCSFPTDGETAHGFYYPPHNPEVSSPDDEAPPAVVWVHGGPTSKTTPAFDPGIQYFTTRGIGVFDLDYRGSTGYGREYRERLHGEWGVVDATDCANAARFLARSGRADPDRIAIRGGSAGGYATLRALSAHDAFDAGASYYGVADLAALAETTHKFESRYLDSLVGPYPEMADRYRERSPVHHADRIDAPLLLLQGEDDPVVPESQAEAMVAVLRERGVLHAYRSFPGEQHGFRRAESIRTAYELELSFYGDVFGFAPDNEIERVDLRDGV